MEILKLLAVREIIPQAVSFLILFLLLRVFFWKKLLKIIDQRSDRLAAEEKAAEEARLSAEKLKADYTDAVARIAQLTEEKISEAMEQGRKITEEMRRDAHHEALKIIEAARENSRYELIKAKEAFKEEIIDMALKAAGLVIEEKLTEGQDRKLVAGIIESMEQKP